MTPATASSRGCSSPATHGVRSLPPGTPKRLSAPRPPPCRSRARVVDYLLEDTLIPTAGRRSANSGRTCGAGVPRSRMAPRPGHQPRGRDNQQPRKANQARRFRGRPTSSTALSECSSTPAAPTCLLTTAPQTPFRWERAVLLAALLGMARANQTRQGRSRACRFSGGVLHLTSLPPRRETAGRKMVNSEHLRRGADPVASANSEQRNLAQRGSVC